MCPGLVVGAPLQDVKSMDKLNTSDASIYNLFDTKEVPDNQFPVVVSVTDVAKAHVAALRVKEAGGHRFILTGDYYSFQLIIDAIREKYPEMRERMIVGKPGVSEVTKKLAKIDTTPAQKILRIKFANWRQSIIEETVPALLELEKKLGKPQK